MIACVMLPYFAAEVARQNDPILNGMPLLLVKYGAKRSKVAAVSVEVAQASVTAGMSLSRARGLCPTAHLLSFDGDQMQTACDRLLRLLWDYTNRIELDEAAYPQTGVFYLDLGTLRDEDARYLGDQLQGLVQQQLNIEVSVGLASGKFPAYVAAAGHTGNVTLVPRHQEAAFVAPYATGLLPASKETARRLALLHIHEIGQLAALPREAVLSQFGREGKLLYALAQGLDSRPVKPHRMPETETVARWFDDPLVDRTRLDVIVHHLAEDLSLRLEERNAALHAVTVRIYLENEQVRANDLYLLRPIGSSGSIARTIQQLIERIKLPKGVCGLEVCAAHLVPNIPRQLELFTHKPGRAQLIDLARVLAARHGSCFYEAAAEESESLLPERRFRLYKVDAS